MVQKNIKSYRQILKTVDKCSQFAMPGKSHSSGQCQSSRQCHQQIKMLKQQKIDLKNFLNLEKQKRIHWERQWKRNFKRNNY